MASPRLRAVVNPKLKDPLADRFCEAVLVLKPVEECYRFLEDVCTVGELKAMAQRLENARLLFEGHTYDEVARRIHASSAAVSRVRRVLGDGADGYPLLRGRPGARPARRRA